jgi:Ca-activated chloride channel family protein
MSSMMKHLLLLAMLCFSGALWAQSDAQPLPEAPSVTRFPGGKPQAVQQPAGTQQSDATASTQPAPAAEQEQPVLKDVARPKTQPAQTAAPTQKSSASAEQSNAPDTPPEGIETIVSTVRRVNLVFTVTDKHGRFIKDLKQDDLRILDDNKPPEKVDSFHSETNLPLRVGLLVDASSSVRDRFRFEQQSAIEFLHQIIRPGVDQAFVLGFDSTQEVTQDFTDNADKLAAGVNALRPGGGTALFDAIFNACRDKLGETKANTPVRRAIILLSDGEDTWSRSLRDEALEQAQRAEVIIYAISTNSSNMQSRGDKVLKYLAESTGGRVFFPYKLDEVADDFRQIQDELRSQYAMTYKPADFVEDGRFRTISLESHNKNLHVRARRGYYAPRPNRSALGGAASSQANKTVVK